MEFQQIGPGAPKPWRLKLAFSTNGVVNVADDSWWPEPFETEVVEARAAAAHRFSAFTDNELVAIWDGLVFDDGIRYGQEPGSDEARLVGEIVEEWERRPISSSESLDTARRRIAQEWADQS